MSWHRVSGKKPAAGHAVLVWEPDDQNQVMAWWCGKRWWQWDSRDDGDHLLPFKPTWWRSLPSNPPTAKGGRS